MLTVNQRSPSDVEITIPPNVQLIQSVSSASASMENLRQWHLVKSKQALLELICDWNTLIVKTILDLTCMINVHVLYFHDNLIWCMDWVHGIAILISQIFLLTVKMIALYSCEKLIIDALIFFYTSILKLQFLLENNYSRKYPWDWCTVK